MQTQNREIGAFAHIVALEEQLNSNTNKRELFKQQLKQDVLNMIAETGTDSIALTDIRTKIRIAPSGKYLSDSLYLRMYSKKWSFTTWDNRFYTEMHSISDNVELTVKKIGGRLHAVAL